MDELLIRAAEVYTEEGVLHNGTLLVRDGIIVEINGSYVAAQVLELGSLRLVPGLIDIHIHGGNGRDTMEGTYEAIDGISAFCARHGVTSFVPTTDTAELCNILAAVQSVREAAVRGVCGAKIAGMFIEGPYLDRTYRGAHKAELLRSVSTEELTALLEAGGGMIRTVIIAPELNGGTDAIRFLTERGVVAAIGHSGATYEQAMRAIEAGGRIGVHTYNAMSPLTHRAPNMVGAVMDSDAIYAEVICDGIHVDFAAVRILAGIKPNDKLVLVSDGIPVTGMPDGKYALGDVEILMVDGIARTTDTGSLAGSTVTLNRALRNLHECCGVPLAEAIQAATINPARAIGIDHCTGSIAVGKRADLVGFDGEFSARFVMIDGAIRHSHPV